MPTDTDAMIHLGGDVYAHPSLQPLLAPIDEVRPHPDNPRNGDTDVIVASVRKNGVYRPVIVQQSTGYALAGNHTYAAIHECGGTLIPRVQLDVDDDTAKRIMAVDNRAADLGHYDEQQLVDLLSSLPDLEGTGYDDKALDDLVTLLADDRWHDETAGGGGNDEGDKALWPEIALRVPPQMFERWTQLLGQYEGEDDVAKLRAHLDTTTV